MRKPLTSQQAAEIEARIGRKLDSREIMFPDDGLIRVDMRPTEERIVDENWKPILKTDPDAAWKQSILDAERAAEAARVAKLPDAERRLEHIRAGYQDILKSRADKQALKDHLAANEVYLKPLRKALSTALYDPAYTAADIIAFRKAIAQAETLGGDGEMTKFLAAEALLIPRRIAGKQNEDAQARIVQLQSQVAARMTCPRVGNQSLS